MAGNGPPPKPAHQRARRNVVAGAIQLPAEGRPGRTPKWPLIPDVVMATRRDLAAKKVLALEYKLAELEDEGKPTGPAEAKLELAEERLAILNAQLAEQKALEAQLWRQLWRLPQAVVWERQHWLRDVAQYVRHKVLAELGDLNAAKEARQWSDRLGLSPMAMLRLRWQIVEDETAARRQTRTERQAPATAAAPAAPPLAADGFAALRAV